MRDWLGTLLRATPCGAPVLTRMARHVAEYTLRNDVKAIS